jgi:hypothetical protein
VQVDRFADIDHIVIGPPGVFPINTKRLLDREVIVDGDIFRSDGWKKKYLAKAEIEARRVDAILRRERIAAKVLPIIAISGASRVKVKQHPHWHGRTIGVASINAVPRRLRKRRSRLSPDEVTRIADVLSDSESWMRRSDQAETPANLMAEYRRINRGVVRLNFALIFAGMCVMATTLFGIGFWVNWTIAPGVAAHIASLFER